MRPPLGGVKARGGSLCYTPAVNCALRLYRPEDAEAMHAAAVESVADVYPWMAWCHEGYSMDEARAWIAGTQESARKGSAYEFAIWDEKGRYLGGCGVNFINPLNRMANLGYWVRSSAAGRGVAAAAARQAADFAFRELKLIRLEIVCAVGNKRSLRVAAKLGALREAVLKNRVLLPTGPSDAVMHCLLPL
jgi:RimJ/RimL family protein N-acetyltransferase